MADAANNFSVGSTTLRSRGSHGEHTSALLTGVPALLALRAPNQERKEFCVRSSFFVDVRFLPGLCRGRAPMRAPAGGFKMAFWWTPPAEMWVFGNIFRSALFTWGERRSYLQTNHAKPPPAGFCGSMRRSRAIKKKRA